ncbi:ADP-heptose:LPS heptosyltransferase II [Pseudodesulfovibrio profundus]|uniref:ADP-heptose:LPS heptosyltransferase II n=1 Tax=Pseudodesulfovibrio profundus TaxID=57320 RepID=A0A2C8F635_9BACT|nr:glycosyltransferase family 9 protein [Pseudodesulfovibrio profundus]SOB57280.1 ADP-heptose:LPS heptosyltransferase II [Pseudodesulfovibrio profundus]
MKRYLIIQLARFGDLIQTKRLVKSLVNREGSEVHLCVDHSLAALASIVYPETKVHSIAAHGKEKSSHASMDVLLENISSFQALREQNFSEVFNLNFSPINFRVAALFSDLPVHGYFWKNGQEQIGTWPAMAMRWSRYRRLGINLMDFWAGYCPDMISPAQVNPQATPKGGGVGVVLSGRESRRSLPVETLSRILTTKASSLKTPAICLLGSKGEVDAGKKVVKSLPRHLQDKTVNLAGKTNWKELVEVVADLDLLITPDTGTMHLAAHLGTPTLAFFLSSAWCFETGPYGLGHTVFQADTSCLPCLESEPCPYDVKCLDCFNKPEFHRFLVTQKGTHAPDNLLTFISNFDELGLVFESTSGEDSHAEDRKIFRSIIHQFLTGQNVHASEMETPFIRKLYQDKDWSTLVPFGTIME